MGGLPVVACMWLGLGAAGLALCASARAEGVAVVVVDPVAPRPLDRAAADRLLASALGQGGGVVVADALEVALARAQAGARAEDELAFFAEAQGKLREAWKAYTLVDAARALALMDEALPLYLGHLEWPGVADALGDLWLRRGAAELLAERPAEARVAVRRARVLDGERAVGRDEFHPNVVALVDAVDAELASAPRAALLIKVTPAADEVWVDGAPVGSGGEVRVEGLAVGDHLVWASARGRRAVGAAVALAAAGGEVALTPAEDPRVPAVQAAGVALRARAAAGPAQAALELVRELAGADEVVLAAVSWRGGELAVSGQRCGGRPLSCGGLREVRAARRSQLAEAARALVATLEVGQGGVTLLESNSVTVAEPPSPVTPLGGGAGDGGVEAPPPGGGRPWWKKGWVWAVAGGAAVVVGTAVLVAATADDSVTGTLDYNPPDWAR
ncbi:MAG: hypothetical protein IT370_32995 [Deltaproteobacteria bacterium]|nr:hypothetical protein [Deltaproteobacteria bacterium]